MTTKARVHATGGSYADWCANKVLQALHVAWRRSGKPSTPPGFDYSPYVGRDPVEVFKEAYANGMIDYSQLTMAMAKVWFLPWLPRRRKGWRVKEVIPD